MTSRTSSSDDQEAHVRHYPLDLHLPFERYEHRRIAARDILVHRIVSKLLFPGSRELAEAFDTHRSNVNGVHNFGPIKQCDRVFAKDLELLRKMLVTCSMTDKLYEPFAMSQEHRLQGIQPLVDLWELRQYEGTNVRVTVGDEILDLVRRYYLETDDPSTRLWLQATEPPMPSSYKTLPAVSQAKETRAASAQQRQKLDERHRGHDEKKWYIDDTEDLRSLQKHTRTARSLDLYDGGALLPPLRQPLMSSRAARMKYLGLESDISDAIGPEEHWAEENWEEVIKDTIYPWPEADAPRHVLNVPSWRSWRQKQRWFRHRAYATPVDFASGRTGRGMDRDGVWSTGRWAEEEGERGRIGRRGRRRASSEPPPDMFISARLSWRFHHPREMLIFPKMNLATADRRSRRRSLSRTRIAEMFNWDTVLPVQPVILQRKLPRQTKEDVLPVSYTGTLPTCAHELECRLEDFRRSTSNNVLWGDLADLELFLFDGAFAAIQKKKLPLKACCQRTGTGSCANCTSTGHATTRCTKPCGFCGAPGPNTLYPVGPSAPLRRILCTITDDEQRGADQPDTVHISSDCPVAKHNRCKCGPFPQYHVATKCPVLCSRKCGNEYPTGHFKHKSAMTCKARCCMCGTKGHSGQQCKLKRCRCGGAHLGQDCRWQVECPVKGCYRFLCGVHCVGCGMSRDELQEGQGFCGGRCPSCLPETLGDTADDVSVEDDDDEGQQERITDELRGGNMQHPAAKGGKGRRKNIRKRRDPEGKKKEKKELPWYAPLQPRTRPIVTSKSGKKTRWRE